MHDINAADMCRVYWGQSAQTRPSDACYFEVFEKLTRACYIQIALETLQLPTRIYAIGMYLHVPCIGENTRALI